MSSVADELRRETLRAAVKDTPEGRLLAALSLGDSDVELRSAATGTSLVAARRELALQRARGRRPSGSAGR